MNAKDVAGGLWIAAQDAAGAMFDGVLLAIRIALGVMGGAAGLWIALRWVPAIGKAVGL